jgi:Ca2+-binding EF-hand superfamily protein
MESEGILSPRNTQQVISDGQSFWTELFLVAEAKVIMQHLMEQWNNVGVVAALVASMAVTLDVFDMSNETNNRTKTTAFATVSGSAFVLSLASVLAALVLFVQANSLFRDEDIKWFIKESQKWHTLPSYLCVWSIITLVLGHWLMIDLMYGFATSFVVGACSLGVMGYCGWLYGTLSGKVNARLCQVVSNVEELRMVFNLIDTSRKTGRTKNRNKVTVKRMKKKLQDPIIQNYIQVSSDRIDKVVAQIDADGDGFVTWEEFRDHLSNRRMTQAFSGMDLDGDGQISSSEFTQFYIGNAVNKDGTISEKQMTGFLNSTASTAAMNI